MVNCFVIAGDFVEMKGNHMILKVDDNLLLPIPIPSEFVSYFNTIKPGDYVGAKGSFIKAEPYEIKIEKITFESKIKEDN